VNRAKTDFNISDTPGSKARIGGLRNGVAVYLIRRLILLVPVVIVATLFLFLLLRGLPGNAALTMLSGSTHTQAMRQALYEELGLDRPWYEQYARWASALLTGKAKSLETGEPIHSILRRQIPVTLLLSTYTIVLSVILSMPLGIVAAVYRNRWPDYCIRGVTLSGLSIPAVWSALLILLLLAKVFGWSPPIFYSSPIESPIEHISIMIWPVMLLTWEYSSHLVRVTRASIIEALGEEYISVAIAKGQRHWKVVIRYAFRNSLVPPITSAGLVFGTLLGGSVVLESVFGIPGIGRGIVQAALARDITVVLSQACILVSLYGLLNIVVDTFCLMLDPRIAVDRGITP
jgi:ABC-type dipeptide/oligopeptide/nickel transport system permease component